jgi:1,2-dihydroxy-3-keto-5-methylthiopentene dioxygenase
MKGAVMAVILIPDENRSLCEPEAIRAFLAPHNIKYKRWPLEERVSPDADQDAILAAYAPEIDRLKAAGGYVTADVINVTPQTPGLDALIQKFASEHTHSEDEVRFILKGRGLFHIHPPTGPVFAIEVEAGDLINVPAHTRHWFHLCADRTIRAIRLFQDKSGWTPNYLADGLHANYQPVCLGPSHVPITATIEPLLKT